MVSCPGWWLVLAGSSLSTSSRAQDNKNPLGQLGEELPAFTNSLANMSVPVERDVTFTCNVKAIGQYRVGWVKADSKAIQAIGDSIITHNSRVSVSGDFTSTFNLHIKQVTVEDAGNYMCQINTDPMTAQTAHMSVMVPPDIDMSRTSGDITAREHSDTAQLVCAAHGVPQPKVVWRREGGQKIRSRNSQHQHRLVTVVDSSRLEIHKVRREDMGAYLCIASNDVPPAVSKRVYLKVQFPPTILPGLSVVGSAPGQKLSLECIVESYPQSFVVWSRADRILHDGGGVGYSVTETPLSMYRISSKLTLSSYSPSQAGIYKCLGKNSLGEAELTTRVYTAEVEDLVPRREPKYEIILEDETEEEEEEEKKKVVTRKEGGRRRNRDRNRNKEMWTLKEHNSRGMKPTENNEQQQQTRRLPGLLGNSCPSLLSLPSLILSLSLLPSLFSLFSLPSLPSLSLLPL